MKKPKYFVKKTYQELWDQWNMELDAYLEALHYFNAGVNKSYMQKVISFKRQRQKKLDQQLEHYRKLPVRTVLFIKNDF